MKVLIDINHPAHVHFFKNLIEILKKEEYEIFITAREKEMTTYLLNKYGYEFKCISSIGSGLTGLAKEFIIHEKNIYRILKNEKIKLVLSIGGTFNVHACKYISIPSLVFTDTENAKYQNAITFPFATKIITPACYKNDLGSKQIRYNGYHELAYLHPNYFKPNPAVLDEIDLSKDDTFIILRFVSWRAGHDIGQRGIKNKIKFIRMLEKYGRVLITSEGMLENNLKPYMIKVSPEKIHDLLYYATLYIGEGATMASESAVLGTHAIFISTLSAGTVEEQEKKYQLVHNFSDQKTMEKEAFDKAVELLEKNHLKTLGREKRERLLKDKIDVTEFIEEVVVKTAGS